MNNLIVIGKTTTGSYVAMSSTPLVATGTLVVCMGAEFEGTPLALVEGLGGTDVLLGFNVPIHLSRIDLSKLKVKSGLFGPVGISFIGHSVG